MESNVTTFLVLLLIGQGFAFHSLAETLLRQAGRAHVLNSLFNIVGYLSCILILGCVGYLTFKFQWFWFLIGILIFFCTMAINSVLMAISSLLFSSFNFYERSSILGNVFYVFSFVCYSVGYYGLYDMLFA